MNNKILGGAVLLLILLGTLGACQNAKAENITVVDETGRSVEVPYPPERIVCLGPTMSEVVYILGGDIVGRSDSCIFPPPMTDVPTMGRDGTPNVELLLEQRPDLVIARPILDESIKERIEAAGVSVILFRAYEIDAQITAIDTMGSMLGEEEKAAELMGFIEEYQQMVRNRTENLTAEEKPLVYIELFATPYRTGAVGSSAHDFIVTAGGRNVAANSSVKYPTLSAEWLLEENPDMIIREVYSKESEHGVPTEGLMEETRDEFISRPGIRDTSAVMNSDVYLLFSKLRSGPRSIVGLIYMAKWFHPDLFSDVNPEEVHREMLQKFYGVELEGTWAYPRI